MKNKSINYISNIMSKLHGIFTETFTIFFSNAGKTINIPENKYSKFQKAIFCSLYKCNYYIVTTNASDFKQFHIIYKFYPIKQMFYLKEFHIWQKYLSVQVKHKYTLPSLHVLYFTGSKWLKFLKMSEVIFNMFLRCFNIN